MQVRLDHVLEAIKGAGLGAQHYYHTESERIVVQWDLLTTGMADEALAEDMALHPECYIPLPDRSEVCAAQWMKAFIADLPEGKAQAELAELLAQEASLSHIEDRVYVLDLEDEWQVFRMAAFSEAAQNWCQTHGIEGI